MTRSKFSVRSLVARLLTLGAVSRRGVVAGVAAFALFAAACGGEEPTPTPPPPTPTEIPTIEQEDLEENDVPDEAVDEVADEADEAEVDEAAHVDTDADSDVDTDVEAEATPEPAEEPTAEPAEDEATAAMDDEAMDDAAMDDSALQDAAWLVSITLPDGTECLHAGRGATMAFDERRVNYTCESEDEAAEGDRILLGEMSARLDLLTVEYGVLGREGDEDNGAWVLDSSEELEMRLVEVVLDDGTVCLNAGQGATLAFDEDRVNFTCDELGEEIADQVDAGEWVLLGDMVLEFDVLSVDRGLVVEENDEFVLVEREPVYVTEVIGEDVEN